MDKPKLLNSDKIKTEIKHIPPENINTGQTMSKLSPNSTNREILEILNHKWMNDSKEKLEVLVKRTDFKDPSWEPMEAIKEDYPIILAKYAKDKGIEPQSTWKWTKNYLTLSKIAQYKLIQLYTKKPKSEDRYGCTNQAVNTIQMSHKLDGKKGETGEIDKETTLNMNKQTHSKVLLTTDHELGKSCIPI